MAATPWRSVGAASAEPRAATVSSTPSHKIDSVLIGPLSARNVLSFKHSCAAAAALCRGSACQIDGPTAKFGLPSRAHAPSTTYPAAPSECIALGSENP